MEVFLKPLDDFRIYWIPGSVISYKKTSFSEFHTSQLDIMIFHIFFYFLLLCLLLLTSQPHINSIPSQKIYFISMYLGRELHPFFLLYHTTIPKSFESLDMRVREREAWGKYERKKKEKLLYGLETSVQKITFFIFFITLPKFLSFFFDSQAMGWRMEKYKGGRNSM